VPVFFRNLLGHYYRHFYQMVNYVDQQPDDLEINKYEYVKTMRAQLSTHEQAILLVNSRTPIGRNWWSNNLIVRYGLVKTFPLAFLKSQKLIWESYSSRATSSGRKAGLDESPSPHQAKGSDSSRCADYCGSARASPRDGRLLARRFYDAAGVCRWNGPSSSPAPQESLLSG